MLKHLSKITVNIGLFLLYALALALPVAAGSPLGKPFILPTPEFMDPYHPAAAYNPDRREYLVAWHNSAGIYAIRLDQAGRTIDSYFSIVGGEDASQRFPDVTYNNQHEQYLVVWENKPEDGYPSIRARRVSAEGLVLDLNDIVLTGDSSLVTPAKPAVAYSATSDRYMVVWSEIWHPSPMQYTIYAQMMTAEGAKDGLAVKVSEGTTHRRNPDIAFNCCANRHLVVWEQYNGVTSHYEIKGRQINGAGGTYGSEIPIAGTSMDTRQPAVASIPTTPSSMAFFVVFQLEYQAGNNDIFGKFLEGDGTVMAGDIEIARSNNSETAPTVAGSDSAQEYLVVWREKAGEMDQPIRARQYTSLGESLGGVYTLAASAADNPAAAAGPLGDFLISWEDLPAEASYGVLFGSLFGTRNYAPLINK